MINLITWLLRIAVFVILAVFASKNSQPVALQYYLDPSQSIELPLSVALLIFFAAGVLITAIFVRCRCHNQ
ncbi:MAG: LapA family protein [Nitrosomonas sp.]|uniref:LapA family protein n=1 Tax=Nitrosomonas sp. TaxID=42353 RepID=UPI0025E6E22B|nr:LapA family protein [Nitrosomonas sp.]UJP02485.1 MAG: LapA family protein [Nitrosomonas sp.]